MRQALAKLDSPPHVTNTRVKMKTEDETFAELMGTMIEDILESFEKVNFRIALQSEINKAKYNANNQVPLQVLSPMSPPIIKTSSFLSPVS